MEQVVRLRERARSGELCLGTFIVELREPGVPAILKNAGFDYFWIDCEHGGFSPGEITQLILTGKRYGICPMVRVSAPTHGEVSAALEAGAEGILIPMVRSIAEVERTVAESKYPPIGRRGAHFLRPSTDFILPLDQAKHMSQTNKELITAIQIETLEAVELIDDIAAREGIDMLYLGPGDLAIAMGHGRADDHSVLKVAERIGRACHRYGKIAGAHLPRPDLGPTFQKMGIHVLGYSAEIHLFLNACTEFANAMKNRRTRSMSAVSDKGASVPDTVLTQASLET